MKLLRCQTLIVAIWGTSHLALAVEPKSFPDEQEDHCRSILAADFSNVADAPTLILNARSVTQPGVPRYCKVEGRVTRNLDVEVRLPSQGWNGKFLAVARGGNGDRCNQFLQRGYACMPMFRHFKKGITDNDWAMAIFRDHKARFDFNRGPHVLTAAGKAITTHYYSNAPGKSYLLGCSAGGNSALQEAQLFPEDYDGIIAGAPNTSLSGWLLRVLWDARNLLDSDGEPILDSGDLNLLHRHALSQCDIDDGVIDGIISNPLDCNVNPSALMCESHKKAGCLTDSKLVAIGRRYSGPKVIFSSIPSDTLPNLLPGSELGWRVNREPQSMQWMVPYFRSVFLGSHPPITPENFDFSRDHGRIGLGYSIGRASDPDLRKFKASGGKLIAYLGANDTWQVTDIVDYYETVERTMGGRASTQEFFRFFLIPGMDHCGGGAGPHAIDYLGYLEQWVEQRRPPDFMIGAHIEGEKEEISFPLDSSSRVVFTRPVYPYPLHARYKGTGDENEAKNFGPVDPDRSGIKGRTRPETTE